MPQTLIGSGSVAAQPVLQALFKTYTKQVNKSVHFVYTADGGNAGVKDVQNGTSQFAGQARTPLPSDAGTTYIKLYLDGLCMDVNPKNKLTNISIQQTHDIYRGLLTNWSQVPGSGLATTIDPVGRDTNGGTYNFFLQAVLNNELPSSNVNALTADGLVVNAVKQDPNAIGYAGLAWQGKGLKALKVNGIPCEAKKISVEPLKYPLSRYIFLVLPTAARTPGGAEIHRLGAAQPGGRRSDHQGRRRPRLQQEAEEEVRGWRRSTHPEYGPKWSDQRVERMLGALVCAVVGAAAGADRHRLRPRPGRPSPITAWPGSAPAAASKNSSTQISPVRPKPAPTTSTPSTPGR